MGLPRRPTREESCTSAEHAVHAASLGQHAQQLVIAVNVVPAGRAGRRGWQLWGFRGRVPSKLNTINAREISLAPARFTPLLRGWAAHQFSAQKHGRRLLLVGLCPPPPPPQASLVVLQLDGGAPVVGQQHLVALLDAHGDQLACGWGWVTGGGVSSFVSSSIV